MNFVSFFIFLMISNDAIIYSTFFHILAATNSVDTKTFSHREGKICCRVKEEAREKKRKN